MTTDDTPRPLPPISFSSLDSAPTATIRRDGHWTWYVSIYEGVVRCESRLVIGSLAKARRVARRRLDRVKRHQALVDGFGKETIR